MKIKVIKRDKSLEDFDKNKIARVTEAAGLKPDQAKKAANLVKKWAEDKKEPQIKSGQIRVKVIEELRKVNRYAADLFEWYKKNQPLNSC